MTELRSSGAVVSAHSSVAASAFSWQMSTSAPQGTGAATTAAATPLAATTASVQLARGWGRMENPVEVMLCAVSHCY